MHAAGIVANHASERAAAVGGGIGTERQMMLFRGISQMIENDSGLHSRYLSLRIDFENSIHVLRIIEDDCDVAALSGK
jgi:hypothetical protein